jgi:hypothetical protein
MKKIDTFYIYNETDGVLLRPDKYSEKEAREIIERSKKGWSRQGFYSSNHGRIPVDQVVINLVTKMPWEK